VVSRMIDLQEQYRPKEMRPAPGYKVPAQITMLALPAAWSLVKNSRLKPVARKLFASI